MAGLARWSQHEASGFNFLLQVEYNAQVFTVPDSTSNAANQGIGTDTVDHAVIHFGVLQIKNDTFGFVQREYGMVDRFIQIEN